MADMDKDDDKIRMLQEKTTLFMITAEAKFEKTKINFEMNFWFSSNFEKAMNVAANEFVNLAKATVRNIDYLPDLITV